MVKKVESIIKKIIIVLILFQAIFMPISNAGFWDNVVDVGKEFIEDGSTANNNTSSSGVNQDNLDATIGTIYNILLALGIVLSVLVGAILGIKIMVGSIEEQAKTKEMLITYVIGCIVVFGAFGIWKLILEILNSATN